MGKMSHLEVPIQEIIIKLKLAKNDNYLFSSYIEFMIKVAVEMYDFNDIKKLEAFECLVEGLKLSYRVYSEKELEQKLKEEVEDFIALCESSIIAEKLLTK